MDNRLRDTCQRQGEQEVYALTLQQAENHCSQTESRHGEVEYDIVAGKHDSIGDSTQTFRGGKVVGRLECRLAFGLWSGKSVHFAQELCVIVVVVVSVAIVVAG